jgi:heptosyltransferase-2
MKQTEIKPLRICAMLPTWVGDACMATPMLRALRQAYPQAEIVAVGRSVICDLLNGAWGDDRPWFDRWIVYDKRSWGKRSRVRLAGVLRREQVDLAVLLANSWWTAAVAKLSGAKRIVGYDRDARGWLLTDRLAVPRQGKDALPISAVDYYLGIANWLGCVVTDRQMQLAVSQEYRSQADALWDQIGFQQQLPTLTINNNAATDAGRLWPSSHLRILAERAARELGWQVLLHCGPSERNATNQLAAEIAHPRVASMGIVEDLPIGLSKAVLERSSCVLSTDSGARHMAVAMNRRVVTLFGTINPAWTTTYNHPEVRLPTHWKDDGSSHVRGSGEAMSAILPEQVFCVLADLAKSTAVAA